MKWYANELGYGDEADYWGLVGLLHDVDFEQYPQEHCKKAPELLAEIGATPEFYTFRLQSRLRYLCRYKAGSTDGKGSLCG